MSTETRAAHEADVDRDPNGGTRPVVRTALLDVALLGGTVAWTAFWLNVARLHLIAESMVPVDLANAAFVTATLVLPAVALAVWHLARRLPVVDTPDRLDGGPVGGVRND